METHLQARAGLKTPIFVVLLSLSFLVVGTTACNYSRLQKRSTDNSQQQLEHEHDELTQTISTRTPTSKWSDEQLDGYDLAISKLERLRLQLSDKNNQTPKNEVLENKLQADEDVIKQARKTLAAVRAEKAKFLSGHDAVVLWQTVNDRVQSIFSEIETLTEPDSEATADQLNAYLKKLEEVRSQLAEQSAIMDQHPELFTQNSKLKDQATKIVGAVDNARKFVGQRLLKDTL